MIDISSCKKKLIASILCANTIFLTMPVNVFASEISGITPTGNTYNIEAAKVSGSTGFRQYEKFNLTKGDIANLKFKDNYSKFVNLVDNQININGIVNTMKGNSFYNGHAIFVSPNGMVIGASGLLNVGSLSVLTPTQANFNSFKNAYDANNLSPYEHNAAKYKELITDSQGNIVVNGKILAREEVNLYGKDIKIGDGTNRAGIIAGWDDEDTSFDDLTAAENTFNSLVSNNITNANSFSLSDGSIQIVAKKEAVSSSETDNIKAEVNIKNADIGANEIDISSTVKVEQQERIDLAEAKVNVEDSNITGDTVALTAEATQKKGIDSASITDNAELIANTLADIFGGTTPSVTSLWGVAGKADANVTVKNSALTALKAVPHDSTSGADNSRENLSVLIHAEASSETSENANLLTPTIIDILRSEEAKIGEFFSSGIYNGFEGAKSSATVNVDNSTINANSENSKNVEISTEATSNIDANNRLLAFIMPIGLYGVGTETESKAIVTASTLNVTKGDIDVNAISSNSNEVNITNDGLLSYTVEDALLAMVLNNTVKSTTEASVNSSTVNSKNLTVFAANLSKSQSEIGLEAKAGTTPNQGGNGQGNSAASIAGILNRSNNNIKALIKDSTVKTSEDTTVLAQSLNKISNSADATVNDKMTEDKKTLDQGIKDKLKETKDKYLNKTLFNMIKGHTSVKADQAATAEAGGVLIWNNTNNTTTAKIENSNVTAGNVTVQANTVDLLSNGATSDAAGEGKFGVGLSVIYNDQYNNTNANISGSTIKADNVTVDATTELPMNQGELTFGFKLPFKVWGYEKIYFGGKLASEPNGKWDISGVKPEPDKEDGDPDFELTGIAEQNLPSTYEDLKPKFRFEGFFNNFAQSAANGTNAAISGSVIYNEIINNTTAEITNGSDITIKEATGDNPQGALTVNAVNSIIGYNAAGLIDFLVKQINYKIPGQPDEKYEPTLEAGRFGLGVNFLWDNYTNNSIAKIDNSKVTAEKGTVNVDAATEQAYITANMTGAKSEAFGIDGSINVQKIKGDTNALISNITGDNEIKAEDISLNAGKAHIKTTAGKIKRDKDTNQIEWKVQDPSAQGDEKYIREAHDEITNIIAQGAWVSQYEEVDNTVQENSQGVAIGTSVTVSDVDRTVKAAIKNATVTSTNDITLNADTYNQKIDVEVAAAFSGGVTQKAAEVEDVQADANAAQDDEDNIFGNLFENEDEYMRNPVGNKLSELQGQFSMSIAGAVDVTTDSTKVEASISDSTVNAGNKLDVKAHRESKNINVDGGLGKSKKVGAGLAANYYNQNGSVKSYIDNSTVKFSGDNPALKVDATNKNWILDIAIGAGAAVNSAAQGKGFQAAIGGSASINTLKPTIEAYINNSTIKDAAGNTNSITTTLNAKNDVDIISISGGGSYVHGGTSGLSAGAAFNYNNIKNTISTYIKDSTLENIGALSLLADADNNLNDFAVAAAIVTGSEGGFNFNFAGGADVDYIHDTVSSKIENSTITADNDINITANSKNENLNVAGTFDFTTAQSGVGVNGDVSVNVYRNTVTSEIDKDSKILKAKDVKVAATSTEKSNVIPVGLSVATDKQFLMAAANVGVNVIDNTVKALVAGNVGTGDDNSQAVNSLNVAAYDETTLYSRGGTVALAAAESIINLAGSFNIDILDKNVEAKILNNKVKSTGDVTVTATSINSMGGTKDNSGSYTRDDVTTDAYKEKMLNKNDKGEYVGLKQNSSFQNWNMFYDIAAGGHVSVAGGAIVKTIQNTVTAEVANSEIEANNLNVIANDYSIKNIIAGAVDASGKGSVGLQGLVTYDRSTTTALITNGSTLNIANTIDLEAINRKDNHQIMVAAGGAGKFSVNANIIYNNIIDKAIAKIDNGSTDKEIKAGTIKVNANEDMNASHIVVTGGGAGSVAVSVSPLINNYDGTVESVINNALIKDAAIDMDANNSIGTLDISVGVSGVGQGLAGTGIAIKNNYTNKVKSYIDNSVINTAKTIDIDANSVIDSNNWIASLAVTGQGVDVIVNVLLNNILSELEAGIKNTSIEKAGAITLNTNKDKKDVFANRAIGLGASGEGVSALVNVVQNIYDNKVKSYVENTSSEEIDSLSINSYSDKKFDNINFGMSFAGIGASILANALVNQIDSSTHSYIDAKSKELNVTNAISLNAKDNNEATNSMAMINVAGEGAAVGANINLYYADNLAKAEVLSNSDGQINAGSSAINSELSNGLDNFNMSVSLGFGALAGDIALIKLGKRSDVYSQAEQKGKIKDAVDYTKDKYDKITAGDEINNKYTPTGSSSTLTTGAIASVKGNLETQNDTTIKAESKLKGLGLKEKLEITNTNVSAGIATVGVGVKDVQFANNTIAEIAGGTVKSTAGDVSVDAISKANIGIKNVKVDVSGVTVSGGGAVYNNTSETLSQIKDATVNAKNINVISNSTSNSTLDSTNVVVSGGNVLAIDLAENKDTNKSSALITGNTNIDATGKLTLHSTVNTDLSSIKSTVKVEGANMVDISKNEVNAGTINRAIIENVNGKITTNGLDIITDYDKLSSYSKANVTAVKLGDVYSGDSSGSFMNADFKSGIDSATGLTLANSGDTNIITAKDNSTDAKGIVSKAEINNVHVSLQGFVASTSAKSENNAKAETVLKAKEHTAKNLNIDSYLNSIADSNAGSVKATVGIGVNVVSVDAKDTSNMNMVISGANTITQNAIINAVHTSNVNSDMSAFNFSGLIGGGQRVRIDSSLTANTTGNIGGDFNANSANISFNTTRNSVMSKSSGSGGGVVNVSDTKAKNTLTGSSTLNISGLNSDTQKGNNNLLVKNISTNTFDVTSSDGSGAIIAVSNNNIENNFTTTTTTNINNSDINSENKVKFEVANNSIVKDTASMGAGGFIAVADTWAGNSYISTAKLALNNTEINAETIDLKSSSDIRTKNSGIVDYVGGVGGFIAENEMNLTNTITQTSEIDIKNSKLNANKDINLNTLTSSFFKQKTDSTVGGFVAMPRSKNWLNVTNNNKISVDETSKLVAGDELEIDFDSNNDLEARAISEAHHFGFRDPVSESYLTFVVNNTLQNNGSIEAGNLIDIDYMQNSINNLTQYAYSEAHAAIPTTTENGVLNKTINNVLNVTTTADITSGKDVDINYSSGRATNSSTIAYKSVCYALFGIPITKTGSKSNINSTNSPALTLNGKIVAGQGNSKYMKINRDGTVDKESLKGFYDDDYTLYDGQQIDGEKVKEQNLASISIEIDNIDESITEVDQTIQELTDRISEIELEEDAVQEKLDEINGLIANGYELKNSVADAQGDSAFSNLIENDIKTLATSGSDQITENQFNIISVAYNAVIADIEQYNKDNPSLPKPVPSVSDFFTNINNYSVVTEEQKATVNGLSSGQKTNVANAYNTVYGNMTQTTKGQFTVYTDLNNNKYVSAINPSGSGTSQTCVEITQFDNEIANYEAQIKPYEDKKASNITNRNLLANKKVELETEYNEVYNTDPSEYEKENSKYAIVFNDVNPKSSHINIDGGYNFNISRSDWAGNGIFSVATNGLKIDNYSTRSLIFNDLNIDSNTYKTGLIIGGKNHSEFADKGQAVSGMDAYLYINNLPGKKTWDQLPTSGVHYKNGGDDISGITVNNYYDINHPFAETFDISNPTTPSSIFFTGDINTANSLNVWNESGTIAVLNDGINAAGKVNFIASNGAALLNISNSSHNANLTLKPNDSIFAADGVFIGADQVDIKGNITTGYSDRSITITDTMLEESNLIVDPTSGEKNMINLGGSNITPYLNATNNIKAIYKDGQIYLYNVLALKQDSSITITDAEGGGSSQGSVTGTIKMADGYQNITIDNQTNKQLNIKDINNIKFSGGLFAENISTTGATITQNTKDHAETNITSTGKLSLNGIINNNLHQDIDAGDVELIPDPNGILNINAKNALDINEKTKAGKVIDSILAGGQVNITSETGVTNILGNITDKGNINILNNGNDKLNINSDITDTEGYIAIQSNGQTEITKAITANLGDIYIASKGLNITEDSKITDDKGNVTITNNASAMTLNGDIKALDGTILFTNNGDSANIGGYVTDENGDIVIVNTKGDMTISSYISHDAVNQSANGMISVTNDPAAGELNIAANIVTEGSGKTVGNDLIAILIDNQSTTKGLSLSETISARLGDIVIKNNVGNLSVSGSVLDNEGNINISSDSQTEISGEITAKEGNIGITSVGLDTTEDSIITTHKGDISINNVPYSLPDYDRAPMNLNGAINSYNGSINIKNQGSSAIVGGNIVDEKGNIFIINQNGPMTISADISQNYLNQTEEGLISVTNTSFGEKLDITGNIINWGKGHKNDVTGITTAIDIYNNTSSSERTYISGAVSARIGDIAISNEHGKLITTSTAEISNTENGNINIENFGNNGADISGKIIATEGNIGIKNTKNDLYINADISEKKGNINITNAGNKLTYLGNTLNELGDTKVVNNGTGIAQIGASIDNTGNVTINNNNGQNLVFDGAIDNIGNTWITNNNGFVHIYGDITNKNGSTIINNQGSFTEITSKINNDTGSIAISNLNGHFKITDTAEINNTSDRETSNIVIVNHGDDTSTPSNLMIDGKINSYNKGFIEIINNGDEANLTGDIFAKDGNIGVTNSNDGKLSFTGNIVDYKGDVTLINNGDDGAEIGGTILDEQGDLAIINNGGDLKITSEMTHNYVNRNAEGMISITNSSNAGKVEIDSAVIATDGAGKTDNSGKTTAILIDNQSTAYGMSLNSTISARIGDIIINNATDDLSTAGMISNYEQGNINITNDGKDYTNTANIINKLGDVNITNNGTGMARVGGSITNQEGNTAISNKGEHLEVSGPIDNNGGNTTITNDNGLTRIVADVTNKGGDIQIANSGEFTEITSAIDNEAGSIYISNSNGNLNITSTASITNTTDDAADSITIANAGDILNLDGTIRSLNKGDIEITNTGSGKANIAGTVTANEGDIDISNSNTGELNISGTVTDYNGNIDVTNDSADGMTVTSTGKITNVKGNTTITNNQGDLTVQDGGQIVNTESGDIKAENKGGKFTISGLFKHSEIGNVTIKNSGTDELNVTSTGKVLAENGNINIQNSNDGGMNIAGTVTDGNGKIDIINSSADGAVISGTILDKFGDTTIYNAGGDLDITGYVVDRIGNIGITNTNGDINISGTTLANDGNITIYDTNGGIDISGYVVDDKGDLKVINKGDNGTTISGTVLAKEGNATVYNDAGALDISGYVTDNKGDLKVINNGDGGADISGTILAKEGNTTIYNTAGTVDISGNVVDNEGKLNITNTADELTTISGTVNAKDGDATIYTNGGMALTDTGYIVDDKGNLSITNKGGDGIDISGTVLAKEGNATVYNDAGALDISGYVTDNKGDLKVINNGDGGADISGTILAKEGNTTVYNDAGALDISGYVTDNKGDLKVINNGDGGTDISGTVLAKEGNTTVYNTAGVLNISGNVVDENGNIDITNTGDDGSIISGIVLAKEGNVNILNEAGDFTISGTVKDEIGNIDINNNGGVAEISGTVLAQNGNIDVLNTNDGELSISGTIKDENGKINITNDSNDGTEISGNVTNVQEDTTITNNAGDLVVTETGKVTNTESGNIKAENNGDKFTIAGLLKHFGIGNIDADNKGDGELEVTETGIVAATDGTININNENSGGILVNGSVLSDKGETNVNNKSDDGIFISTTGKINNQDGDININNTGKAGIDVHGSIRTEKQNININNKDSDLRIGEYASDNDNYITAAKDNVIINQTNGNILNNITDPDTGKKHQNADLGNPDQAYKTLIATGNNLVINAKDGDIGSSTAAKPGYSIDANTRDYTESINVNVKGNVTASATNKNSTDARLVNIRAKDSDLNVENVKADGNVMLTAADWKQPDTRPTPKDDESYFKGYSVLNAAQGDKSAVIGQNISVIASDRIGTEKKPFAVTQDTKNAPNSSVSFEGENDVNILVRSNSKEPVKINQLISKRGDIGLVLDDDGVIREITAGDHLHILQRAKNLTIYDLGMSHSGGGFGFNDMLYPHDGLKAGGGGTDGVVPQSVAIEVLDSKGGNNADSTLKIYSAAVKGRNNGEGAYDKNGRQIADISLMADNIYANSAKAPDSTVETKANPNGYKQTDKTYSDAEFGIKPSKTYDALGFNAYGPGTALSFDIKGVDKNFVKDNVPNATRTNYHKVYSVDDVTDKFKNDNNQIKDYDYKANNVVLSVNDNVKTNRGVNINSIYADNAYINSKDSKLAVQDGYITNYAEFRNRDKIAAVDNDYRRIVDPADIQLYTAKTGSFSLLLKDTINMHTTAPTVYNNPYMLVNGYHSAWNFVNRGRKEAEHQIENIQLADSLRKKYEEEDKRISMRFDTTDDEGLQSDVEIYDISSTGALIKNDRNLKKGDEITISLKFEDVDTKVKAKVVNLKDDKAGVAFIKLPKAVSNKILYRYMQQANSTKSNLTSSL